MKIKLSALLKNRRESEPLDRKDWTILGFGVMYLLLTALMIWKTGGSAMRKDGLFPLVLTGLFLMGGWSHGARNLAQKLSIPGGLILLFTGIVMVLAPAHVFDLGVPWFPVLAAFGLYLSYVLTAYATGWALRSALNRVGGSRAIAAALAAFLSVTPALVSTQLMHASERRQAVFLAAWQTRDAAAHDLGARRDADPSFDADGEMERQADLAFYAAVGMKAPDYLTDRERFRQEWGKREAEEEKATK